MNNLRHAITTLILFCVMYLVRNHSALLVTMFILLILFSFDPPLIFGNFKRFTKQNYNEFRDVRWHDYLSLIVDEFAVLLIRRYDFGLHEGEFKSVYHVQILGFKLI
jgi:hypothetical protein